MQQHVILPGERRLCEKCAYFPHFCTKFESVTGGFCVQFVDGRGHRAQVSSSRWTRLSLEKKNESNNEVRTRAGKTKKPSGQLKSSWNTRKEDCRRAHTGACTGFTWQLTPGVSVLQAIQLVALVVPSSTPSGL
jgi:hypothetical protein